MICVLHYGLSPNRGGIESYLYKIWKNIDHNEFKFDFVDEWGGKACYRRELEKEGCRFFDVTPRRKSIIRNKKDWIKAIKDSKADIVHCHLNTMSYDTPIRSALKCGVRVIVHSRNSGGGGIIHTQFLHFYHKIKYRKSDVVRLAVSKEAGKWLFGEGISYTVINNGIDIEKYKYSAEKRKRVREHFGIDEGTFVIGNVAAFLPVKNQAFLLDVFKEVLRINSNAILTLCGDGMTKRNIEEKALVDGLADKVIFAGNRPDIPDMLSFFDVFVMPSFYEGFPNAVLEAETNGLKCILSDAITKEVDVGKCYYLGLNEDAERWAEVITDDMCDVKKDREYYYHYIDKSGFSVAQEIRKLERIYRGIENNV